MSTYMNDDWKGYTLDELRYRRAAVSARNQVEKTMLSRNFEALRTGNPITRSWQSMQSIFSTIGYVNSAILGWQLLRRVLSVVRTIRRK